MTPRRWSAMIALSLGVLAVFALPAAPASAHASLVRSAPSTGTVVETMPGEVVLTFSEAVRPIAEKIRLTGPDGKRYDTGKPVTRDAELVIPVRAGAPRGTYLLGYRVISADSHPISGGFSFSVGEVSATPTEDVAEGVETDKTVKVAMAVARYAGFAGLVLLVGPVLVLSALWPRRLSTRGAGRLARTGAGLVALGALLELYLQVPYTSGTGLFSAPDGAVREVLGSQFGAAHLVRLAVVAAVIVLLQPVINGKAGKIDQTLLVILGVVGLATWPVSGHPTASPVPSLTVVADVAHLAAMSVWLGGLVMLFGFLLRRANARELGAILPVWSGWALFAVTVLVLAGTAQALIQIGTVSGLTETQYGRLVMVKIGLLAVVLAVAAYSRRLTNRHYAAEPDGEEPAESTVDERVPRRLRAGVLTEVGVAAVVLTVTAWLVQTTPARSVEATGSAPNQPAVVTVSNNLFKLEVDVAPARVGMNTIHLYAYQPGGSGTRTVVEWKGTAALPSQGVEPIDIPLLAITPDHASGQVLFPAAGTWELRFTVRVDELNQATVTVRVPIRS